MVRHSQGGLQGAAAAEEPSIKLLVLVLCPEGFVKPAVAEEVSFIARVLLGLACS